MLIAKKLFYFLFLVLNQVRTKECWKSLVIYRNKNTKEKSFLKKKTGGKPMAFLTYAKLALILLFLIIYFYLVYTYILGENSKKWLNSFKNLALVQIISTTIYFSLEIYLSKKVEMGTFVSILLFLATFLCAKKVENRD